MSHGGYSFYEVMRWLPAGLPEVVLDAGCGAGEMGLYLKTFPGRSWSRLTRPPSRLIGYDINQENIERLRPLGIYDQLILDDLVNVRDHLDHVELTTCLETLEHIKKEKARGVLRDLVSISDKILVITPYGESTNEAEEVENRHVSAWWPEDLEGFGLEVHVVDAVSPLLPRPVRWIYQTYMMIRGWAGVGDGRRIIGLNFEPWE